MPIETEAYVARGDGGPKLEKVSYLDPGPKDLIVDVVAASVCHTDVKASEGTFHMKPPMILGHEAAGYVRSVGSGVTYAKPGDAVVLSYANCGACQNCLSGMAAYCEDLFVLNFTGRRTGESGEQEAPVRDAEGEVINGLFFGQSSMSRVALCHESCAVKVDARDKDELIKFASLGCGIQTGAGAIWNVARPPVGSSIAVFGGGAVGLAAILAAKATAPASIILVDTSQTKLGMIPKDLLAGVKVLNSSGMGHDAVVQKLKDLSGDGKGLNYALDCVGNGKVLSTSVDAMCKRGTVMTIGSTSTTEAVFRTEKFLVWGLTYRGMHQGDSVPRVMIPEMIRQWRQGRFPFDQLLARFNFDELSKSLDDVHAGRVIKPLLVA